MEWNHLDLFMGKRGYGKSTKALEVGLNYARTPAYVIAHDPGGRIGHWTKEHGEVGHLVRRFRTPAELLLTLRSNPGGIHCIESDEAEEAIDLALRVARFSKASNGPPVVLWINEVTSCASASPQRISGDIVRIATQGRHDRLGIMLEAQSSRLVNYNLLSNCTYGYLFRLTDQTAIKRLEDFEVPSRHIERLPSLARYEYIEWDPDNDIE